MKAKILIGIALMASLVLIQGCEFSNWRYFTLEYYLCSPSLDSGVGKYIMEIKPSQLSTWEIPKGTYTFKGNLVRQATSGIDTAVYPSQLTIILKRKTPKNQAGETADANAKKIKITLNMNPTTGNIPEQNVKIRKGMLINPTKKESLRIYAMVDANCAIGDKLHLEWEKN